MKCSPDTWLRVLSACLFVAIQSPGLADGRTLSGMHVSLSNSTVAAFRRYVANTELQQEKSLGGGNFLWIDNLPTKERQNAYSGLKHGEVEMRRVPPDASSANTEIPGGMIHDWKGIVFIPGAKMDQVLRVLQDYNRHATVYAPDVEKAKIEQQDGNHYLVFLRFRRTKVLTVVLDTEHEVNYFRDSPTRAHSRSSAIRIAEVETPEVQRKRKCSQERTKDSCGKWRPGGDWRRKTAECTCRIKWCRSQGIFPPGWAGSSSPS